MRNTETGHNSFQIGRNSVYVGLLIQPIESFCKARGLVFSC